VALGAGHAAAQVGTSFLVFPGSGDGYVEIPHASALNPTTAITIEAWLYLFNGSGCVSLLGKNWIQAYWLGVCESRLRFYARGSGSARDSTGTVPLGQWVHVAVTHDGSRQKFFIDGELAGDFDMGPGPLTTSTAPVNIGSDAAFRYTPRGAMHEVRLWSIARTQAAIQGDRLTRLTSPRSGLVAVWPLDTDARDALGGHPGSLVGGARFGSGLELPCDPSYWIATAASISGAGGSQWATDVALFNPATQPATARLYLLPRDGDNGDVVPLSRTVPAGQVLTLPDVVRVTFGQTGLAGAIQICADRPLVVTSRTYTREGGKTYGFGALATRRESAIAPDQTRHIADIRESTTTTSGFRTNLGLTNVSKATVTVTVTLILADGTTLPERTYTVKPWSHIQRNRIVRDFTAADVTGAVLAIRPSGGSVIGYAAVVDNSTNDSTYLEALY
jgi:hypothetical protein